MDLVGSRRLAVTLAAALAAAAAVVVLGFAEAEAGAAVGALLSGTSALAGGAVLAGRFRRSPRDPAAQDRAPEEAAQTASAHTHGAPGDRAGAERFRLLLSLGCAFWGAGQVVVGLQLFTGSTFPTAGDLLSAVAAPVAMAGLLLLPRPHPEPFGRHRLAFEALMLGASAQALLWVYWFRGSARFVPGVLGAGDWAGLLVLSAELVILAVLLVCAGRDLDRGVVIATVAFGCYVVADVAAAPVAGRAGGSVSWVVQAVACLAWPFVVVGVREICSSPTEPLERHVLVGEGRRSVVIIAACSLPLGLLLAGLLAGRSMDRAAVVLLAAVVVGFGGRELVRGLQSRLVLRSFAEQALRDPLTGLRNRRALTAQLAELESAGERAAVLTLDVDRFKDVNTYGGHVLGDAVLAAVATALERACQGYRAVPFRMGGDEFAALFEGDAEEARRLAERIRADVRAEVAAVPGIGRLDISCSVGVAPLWPAEHARPDVERRQHPRPGVDSLARSVEALRVAKSERDRVCFYSRELDEHVRRRAAMEQRLRLAIETEAIAFHYEPVVELATGRVKGLEALARWHDPELGNVRPDVFIGAAEQIGLISELGRQAVEQSLRMAAAVDIVRADLTVGVNVSPLQLRCRGFVDEVAEALKRHSIPPQRFILEVTEGIFMDPDDVAVQTLEQLTELGVSIAIDDFGSGYSSLGYMSRLPADIIKVDRSLIARLEDPRTQGVVRAIRDMGVALGLDVVMEGVETRELADRLRSLGAQYGQGWLYSRPVPAAGVPAMLAGLAASAERHVHQAVVAGTR